MSTCVNFETLSASLAISLVRLAAAYPHETLLQHLNEKCWDLMLEPGTDTYLDKVECFGQK